MRKICTKLTSKPTVPLSVLVERILVLAQAMAEKEFYLYQYEFCYRFVEAVLLHDGDMLTACFSRQSGKSECVADTVDALLAILPALANSPMFVDDWRLNLSDEQGRYRGFKNGILIGVYGPKQEQADIIFSRAKACSETDTAQSVYKELGIQLLQCNANRIRLSNGSNFRAETASEQSKIEGDSYHVLVLDECQDISTTKIRKCFAEDTKFITKGGKFCSIKNIVKKQKQVYTPSGLILPTEFHDNGVQPVYKITTDNGRTLTTTANHRHLVCTRTRKKPFEAITSEIKEGWRIAVPDSTPIFGNKGTYGQGLILGTILGDGCVTGDKPQVIVDKVFYHTLDHFCQVEFGVNAKLYNEQPSGMLECGLTQDTNCKYANRLTEFLREIGVWGCKGADKFVPNKAWSKAFLHGLVEGLIVTDGSVENPDKKPVISFANSSEKLVTYLQDTLLKFGVHCTRFEGFVENSGSLPGSPNHPGTYMYRLHVKSVLDIARFYKQFKLYSKQPALDKAYAYARTRTSRQRSNFYASSIRFACVKQIEYAGKKKTYCVTVPTDEHLVVANGLLTKQSLHPMIAAYNGVIVKVGTPSIQKSDFYTSIKTNERIFAQGGPKNHYQYDYTVCGKHNSLYAAYIEKEKVHLGEESDEFRLSYKCEWLLERGQFVTSDNLLSPKVAHTTGLYGEIWTSAPKYGTQVAGIDFGKIHDPTVVTVIDVDWNNPVFNDWIDTPDRSIHFTAYQKHIVAWIQLLGDNYESQFTQIVDFLGQFKGLRKITLDATGVGQWGYDKFSVHYSTFCRGMTPDNIPEYDSVVVDGINFSSPQIIADGYKLLHTDICTGRITFPAGEKTRKTSVFRKFVGEMLDLRKVFRNGHMRCEAPEEPGAHDDFPTSTMLACISAQTPVESGFEVSSGRL